MPHHRPLQPVVRPLAGLRDEESVETRRARNTPSETDSLHQIHLLLECAPVSRPWRLAVPRIPFDARAPTRTPSCPNKSPIALVWPCVNCHRNRLIFIPRLPTQAASYQWTSARTISPDSSITSAIS